MGRLGTLCVAGALAVACGTSEKPPNSSQILHSVLTKAGSDVCRKIAGDVGKFVLTGVDGKPNFTLYDTSISYAKSAEDRCAKEAERCVGDVETTDAAGDEQDLYKSVTQGIRALIECMKLAGYDTEKPLPPG